jgi:hypothetical protein
MREAIRARGSACSFRQPHLRPLQSKLPTHPATNVSYSLSPRAAFWSFRGSA